MKIALYMLEKKTITLIALILLSHQLLAFEFLSSTYLGDESDKEAVFATKILSDGNIVVGAELGKNTKILQDAEFLFNHQDSSQKIGVIFLIAPDGKTIKQKSIISSQIKDIAIDQNDIIYVAAGTNGVICLSSDAKKILWKTLDGIYVHRIDATQDGIVAALADLNKESPDNKSGRGTIYVFDREGKQISKFPGHSASDRNILDICIDSKSKSIITVGWRQATDWSEAANKGGPVQIALIRAMDYEGIAKWTAYDWSTDGKSERYLNKPENNMADTRGLRCSIGEDGKLYAVFMCAGGNHMFRYNPFNINEKVEIPKGDPFNDFSSTKSQHKTFFARYNPENGQYESGQQITARSDPLKTNTLWCDEGEIYADKDGNVYLAGISAYGLPIRPNKMLSKEAAKNTFNPFGATSYLGGPFLIINAADMTQRNYVTRISPYGGTSRTVCARTLKDGTKIIAWGGTVALNGPAYTKEAIQTNPGFGETDAFLAVLSNITNTNIEDHSSDTAEVSIESGIKKKVKIRNSDPQIIDLTDANSPNAKKIAFLYPWSEETPLTPSSEEFYQGTPLYGALYMEILNPTQKRKNIHRNEINSPFKLEFSERPKNEAEKLLFRAVYFIKTSDFDGYQMGDKFSFNISSSLETNTSCPSLYTYPWISDEGKETWKVKFWMQTHFRWLVKDSGKFYLSKIMPEWKSHQNNTLILGFQNDSDDGDWAEWTPSNDLHFDERAANFAKRDFSNIEAVGCWFSDPDYRPTPESLAAGKNKPKVNSAGIKLNSFSANLARNMESISRPVADFSVSDLSPFINQSVSFDSSPSLPGKGSVNFAAWNFGDGSKTSGSKTSHSYMNFGPHYVKLTIWNNYLQCSSVQKRIEVFPPCPETEKKRIIAAFGGSFPTNAQMPEIIRGSKPLRKEINDIDGDSIPDLELSVPFDDKTPFSTTAGTRIYAGWTAESKMPLQKEKETHINNKLTIDNFAKYKKKDTKGFYTLGYRTRKEIPGRVRFIAMIFKEDFMNGFDSEKKVKLSKGFELFAGPFAEIPNAAKIRFVIREKGTYWVSDKFFSRPANFKSDVSFESLPVFKIDIITDGKDQCKWAKFDPFTSLEINDKTTFSPQNFTDLDGFGILSDSGYQSGKNAEFQMYGFKLLSPPTPKIK